MSTYFQRKFIQTKFQLILKSSVSAALCALLGACFGSPKIQYSGPPGVTQDTAATIKGTRSTRNNFNDSFACILKIDNAPVADERHQLCKFLFDQTFLLSPGRHRIDIGFAEESGERTWGSGKQVSATLEAGKTYTVQRRMTAPDIVQVWLADDNGTAVSDIQEFNVNIPSSTSTNVPLANTGLQHVAPKQRLFVYADFGDRAKPFEDAFTANFQALTTACNAQSSVLLAPHAIGLTLNAPHPPSEAEIQAQAKAFSADSLLRIRTTRWTGPGSPPADVAEPYTWGVFEIDTRLFNGISGPVEWNAQWAPKIAGGKDGGREFARTLVRRLANQGAFANCPETVLR